MAEQMTEDIAVRTEVRGQCERGHVVKGEAYGPSLPDEWRSTCPLPACGAPIEWNKRPDWLPALSMFPDTEQLSQIIRKVDGSHRLGAGALAEAIINRLTGEKEA